MKPESNRYPAQRGSALLIVFLFAAFVAIMLYREMPVAAFEAKRQKEETLIDRGEQYKRAVKLFYKKFGMYPASMEQLENTNRLRFLRHRFVDPFTGKDDWRLLHAGPGGMLIDSKVNPLKNGLNQNAAGFGSGSNSGFGSGSGFGNNSGFGAGSSFGNQGFGNNPAATANTGLQGNGNASANSGFGSTNNTAANSGFGGFNNSISTSGFNSASDQGTVVVPNITRRPPAISSSGSPSVNSTPETDQTASVEGDQQDQSGQLQQNPDMQQPADSGQPNEPNTDNGTTPDQDSNANLSGETPQQQMQNMLQRQRMQMQQDQGPVDPNNPQQNMPQQNPMMQRNPLMQQNFIMRQQMMQQNAQAQQNADAQNPQAQAPGQITDQSGATGGTQNSLNTIRQFLGTPGNQGQTSGLNSNIRGGGLAGVASKAQGHAIKVINDQVDYSLWEFYYDPSKDTKSVMSGVTSGMNNSNRPSGFANNPNSTGFSNANQTNGFNQNGFNSNSPATTSSPNSQTNPTSSPGSTTQNPPQ
ncbi:MAG: hypothetical protein JOY62_09430 [Acidobacteriaceae bacterium]|nr:hypothetical protein [Acidobacteriaceae bacterium]MBV9780181.1 hypothetical protein [Acidobacteriaceae bacterium]